VSNVEAPLGTRAAGASVVRMASVATSVEPDGSAVQAWGSVKGTEEEDLSLRLSKADDNTEGDRKDANSRISVPGAGGMAGSNNVQPGSPLVPHVKSRSGSRMDRRTELRNSRSPSVNSRGSSVVVPKQDRWGSFTQKTDPQRQSANLSPNSSLASTDTNGEAQDVTEQVPLPEAPFVSERRPEQRPEQRPEWEPERSTDQPKPTSADVFPHVHDEALGPLRTEWYDDSEYVGTIDNVMFDTAVDARTVAVDPFGRILSGLDTISIRTRPATRTVATGGHGREVRRMWPRPL